MSYKELDYAIKKYHKH